MFHGRMILQQATDGINHTLQENFIGIRVVKSQAPRFDEGAVYINEMLISDPHLPFGGIKNSGYGRELSYFGVWEFANIKTVVVK